MLATNELTAKSGLAMIDKLFGQCLVLIPEFIRGGVIIPLQTLYSPRLQNAH